MKLTNLQDRKECAQEIAEVRKTGRVNMWDRMGVAEVLYDLGYDFTAEHITDNRDDYLSLLKESGKY